MPVIVVANPKGGVGKTTLSTNLAGYLASRGHAVMLGDVDRQQSAREWLKLRPPQAAPIQSWDIERGKPAVITPLLTDLYMPHQMAFGPDGKVYVNEQGRIFRFEPLAADPDPTALLAFSSSAVLNA